MESCPCSFISTPFITDLGPNPFHDAPAVHTHQNCSYCHRFRRCEFKHLQRCARCRLAFYCSKECQKSHWREHKILCKTAVELDKEIETGSGIPNGYTDFMQWIEYYSTPMKNCMIAALNLPHFPHQQRDSVLAVHLRHKGDVTLPIQHRYIIQAIRRHNRGDENDGNEDGLIAAMLATKLDSAEMKNTIEFGKKELGSDYYGTGMIMVTSVFSMGPQVSIPVFKCFAINKSAASARVISGPWWPPLRDILENGKKMTFCCGKIEGVGCCCGGWVHNSDDSMKGNVWR